MRLLAFQERAEGLFLLFTGTAGGGSDLERFGNRLLAQVRALGWERELNPPCSGSEMPGAARGSHRHLLGLEEDEGDCSRRGLLRPTREDTPTAGDWGEWE